MSNFPSGYSEDGDAAHHGSETAIYQDLVKVRQAFEEWFIANRSDFPSDHFLRWSNIVGGALLEMEKDLNCLL